MQCAREGTILTTLSYCTVTAWHIAEGRSRLNLDEKNGISIRTKPAKQLQARLWHPQEDTAAVSRVFCEDKKVVVWF